MYSTLNSDIFQIKQKKSTGLSIIMNKLLLRIRNEIIYKWLQV